MPRIGSLRHKVTIEQKSKTGDGRGGSSATWGALISDWSCELLALSGNERLQAAAQESRIMAKLRLRSSSETRAIKSNMRARVEGEVYNIRSVLDPDGRKRWLILDLESTAAN